MASREIYPTNFDEDVRIDSSANQCPECDGRVATNIVETVCTACGLIIEENRIDHGPEWREHDINERKRTGSPLSPARHDRGISTEIGRDTDANGTQLSNRKHRQLNRLRREHRRGRWRSKREGNLAYGLSEIRRTVDRLEIGSAVRNQACTLFREAQTANLLQGRSIESIAAASVYGVIRCNGLAWTLEDIEANACCEKRSLRTAYSVLNSELGLSTQPQRPSDYVPRFVSELEAPDHVRRRAYDLAKRAESKGVVKGHDQPGLLRPFCITWIRSMETKRLNQRSPQLPIRRQRQFVHIRKPSKSC